MLIPTVTRTVQDMLGSKLREPLDDIQYSRGLSSCHIHMLGRHIKAPNGRRLGSGKDVKVEEVPANQVLFCGADRSFCVPAGWDRENIRHRSRPLPHKPRNLMNYVKVKFTLEQATKAQRGSKGIVLLFFLTWALDGGGWSTPLPGRFTPGKDPVPLV